MDDIFKTKENDSFYYFFLTHKKIYKMIRKDPPFAKMQGPPSNQIHVCGFSA